MVKGVLVRRNSYVISNKDESAQRNHPAKSDDLAKPADRLVQAVEQRYPTDDGSYFAACGGYSASALVRSGSNYRRPAVSDE